MNKSSTSNGPIESFNFTANIQNWSFASWQGNKVSTWNGAHGTKGRCNTDINWKKQEAHTDRETANKVASLQFKLKLPISLEDFEFFVKSISNVIVILSRLLMDPADTTKTAILNLWVQH